MRNSIVKTTKSREVQNAKYRRLRKTISEEDIRCRAFEIYQKNGGTSHNELDDWLRAERELRGSAQ